MEGDPGLRPAEHRTRGAEREAALLITGATGHVGLTLMRLAVVTPPGPRKVAPEL